MAARAPSGFSVRARRGNEKVDSGKGRFIGEEKAGAKVAFRTRQAALNAVRRAAGVSTRAKRGSKKGGGAGGGG